jgi:DNA polymerase I-like protein with 3'-5' exonuclease and polymerase domains
MTRVVAFDTETHLIGPGAVAPPLVCGSFAWRSADGAMDSSLMGNHPDDGLEAAIERMLLADEALIVTHSGGFDWTVVCAKYPRLLPLVFKALLSGHATDTKWREKLLNLSTTGRLDKVALPDGSSADISYHLADLTLQYTGQDRSHLKEGDDIWRLAYAALDGWRAADYPQDAADYAIGDATDTLLVYEAQERRKAEWKMASTATEEFRTAAHFALYLMSAHGVEVDPEETARVRAEVTRRIDEVEGSLVAAGFIEPAVPMQPYKSQGKRLDAWAKANFGAVVEPSFDWSPYREELEKVGVKFTEAKKSKRNTKPIQEYVAALYKQLGEIPTMTDGGEKAEPQIKLDGEVQEYLAYKDPLMEAYHGRQSLQKIIEQLDVLESGPVIYPQYDVLKETGRTSSYGNSKTREPLYPSANIQQVPGPRDGLDVRRCYRPREGRVFFDVDVTGLELATVAQVTYDLFGTSVHMDRYNAGVDLHGYLGAQLGLQIMDDELSQHFRQLCKAERIADDPMGVYDAFMRCKKHEDEPVRKWFKHVRTFAKPVGLGLPGGLGPETLVDFARKTYGVLMTVQQASDFREVWRATYPEMPRFFDWISGQTDEHNGQNEAGEKLYWYETPLGMIRRGATYCAAANGKCMQSPGAEVAETWTILVQRECYDPTQESVLLGARPVAFVHDQILGETTREEALWHDQCMRVKAILQECSKLVLPDVNIRSDEAHLTRRWTKDSVPVFGPDGRLIPWEPKQTA